MSRVLALIVAAVIASAAATIGYTASERAGSRPALKLLDSHPLVVRGTGFHPRERLRITVYAKVTRSKRMTASAGGSFRIAFGDVIVSRCNRVRVIAIGNSGSRAELKNRPLPACLPA